MSQIFIQAFFVYFLKIIFVFFLREKPKIVDPPPKPSRNSKQSAGKPMLANQNTGKPMLVNQNIGKPMLTNQNIGKPMSANQNIGKPILANQNIGKPMLANQNPRNLNQQRSYLKFVFCDLVLGVKKLLLKKKFTTLTVTLITSLKYQNLNT